MSEPFQPDLSLFRLPLPDPDRPATPELERLGNHAGSERRAQLKRRFWGQVDHERVGMDVGLSVAPRELVPEARLDALARGPGVICEPHIQDQPLKIAEALEECTPQFCLRNLHRYEKDAWVESLWWEVTELRETPGEIADALSAIHRGDLGERAPPFLDPISLVAICELRDERDGLIEGTDWGGFTWRRGPRRLPDDEPGTDNP